MRIAVCVKWVDLHPKLDLGTGSVDLDERRFGFSPADAAALETALAFADERGDTIVRIVCAGPASAEPALRELSATGAAEISRVDLHHGADSALVASAVAAAVADCELVLCGDYSLDRQSATVPPQIAAHLGWPQCLGVVEVELSNDGDTVLASRRLDGGWRERVSVDLPAVVSVEGSVATLRRAGMPQVLAARNTEIVVVEPQRSHVSELPVGHCEPLRPRTRRIAPPVGTTRQRIVELTGALVDRTPPRRIDASPQEAAAVILEQLRAWGYVGE
jgi:electron transfer flavoprotein beta subunit